MPLVLSSRKELLKEISPCSAGQLLSHLIKICTVCKFSYLHGNGSFRSYSRSDPGSFRSYSLSVRSFRPGSFRSDLRGGSFRPFFGGSFRPTLFYIVFR